MSLLWQQLLATSALEWFGTVTGLLAVALSVRQHLAAWPLFIACYAAYAWLSASAGLFAAASMNAVFVVLSIEGWRTWRRSETDGDDAGVRATSPSVWVAAALTWVGASVAITVLLRIWGQSTTPWLDAGSTAAGFIAQGLLSRKSIATWTFWLASDVGFMVLYGREGYWLTVGLFGVFVALAVHGHRSWQHTLSEAAA